MKVIEQVIEKLMKQQHFDNIAVGVIDFKKKKIETIEWHENYFVNSRYERFYYDLASLTKPLTLAATYLLDPSKFTDEMKLLLNHRAGLTSGGRISSRDWRSYINSFKIVESPTLYSDYSALRAMLEIEKVYKRDLYSISSFYWDSELLHWTDLKDTDLCSSTGMRRKKVINGAVHDDNAYYLGEKVSHAGLFSTIDGICQSLIKLNDKTSMLEVMDQALEEKSDRFVNGWDTVTDLENSLAGSGCSSKTFGHLGFTGTSIWIDCEKQRGAVILSNATKSYWYDRKGLTMLRKEIGQAIWSM
ncbi:serine hydrolase domain-containing protein [Halobacteriovorax sp. HLS]|uniref:serine hydrolase domain-containing protein n=1 Tax=Halobacteriovorax sp. HLS TaxID=2234000 RepID=UPI000FDBBE9B|nr:serine hydrolase domain-containing protein [Halobacteriovorax sp. HLS]